MLTYPLSQFLTSPAVCGSPGLPQEGPDLHTLQYAGVAHLQPALQTKCAADLARRVGPSSALEVALR